MKQFIIIFILIVSTECGLLDDLVSSKAKTETESNLTGNRQGVLLKVGETLKNGTKVVIDALGNVIKISPKEKVEDTKSKGPQDSPKDVEEVLKKEEASKPDPKTELPTSTEKVKVEAPKVDDSQIKTTEKAKVEAPKADNQNKTLPTVENATDAANNVEKATDSPKPDDSTGGNCTSTDDKDCKNVVLATRTSFKGDECPAGKNRADDGTCVEEVK